MKTKPNVERAFKKLENYLEAPKCSYCKSRNVIYRKRDNNFLCRRCGGIFVDKPRERKE